MKSDFHKIDYMRGKKVLQDKTKKQHWLVKLWNVVNQRAEP